MNFISFCLFAIVMLSCNTKPTNKIDNLLIIDSIAHSHSSLTSFSTLNRYTKEINGIAICDSVNSKCRSDEQHYTVVLRQISLSINTFNSLVSQIDDLGFIKYYRHGDYSVWVEGGAFGDIYGYLINHNPLTAKVESFELDKRYHVGVGKMVSNNVYYFSSLIE
jgi:hypothetical protein